MKKGLPIVVVIVAIVGVIAWIGGKQAPANAYNVRMAYEH